jgi:geranylgeranyl diphosphate synthase type I
LNIKELLAEMTPEIDAEIEKLIPRRFNDETIARFCGPAKYDYDTETATKSLAEPIWDLLDRGGKRLRPALLLLTAEAFNGDMDKIKPFCALPEIVHNGTLMVDDVEDSSEMRRSQPCTHKKYGVDVAVNAGNAMYFLPLALFKDAEFDERKKNAALEIYYREMTRVSFGQAFDIWWHHGRAEPTEAQYLQMCSYKTGCLMRMAMQLGAVLADASPEQVAACGEYAESLGVGFQIQDDILDLVGEEFAKKRRLGEDVHEGKRTLMVIHAFANSPKAERLREILAKHTEDEAEIGEAIAIMREAGSIDYAKQKARSLAADAWKILEPLLPNGEPKEKLEALTRYLVEREI